MTIRLLKAAQEELDESIAYYNAERAGLGDEVLLELIGAVERIGTNPDSWPPFHLETRRYRLKRFPYGVIYLQEQEVVVIVAFAHLHRRPEYWADRMQDEGDR